MPLLVPPRFYQPHAGLFVAGGGGGGGTVVFDAVSNANNENNAGTTMSWTHTPVASPPSSLAVVLQIYNDASNSVSGITYNGAALTKMTGATSGSQGGFSSHTEIWGSDGLTLPSGAQTVQITFAATGSYCQAGAISVTGSNTTTCFSNAAVADNPSSTTPSVTVTSATGELVVDITSNSAGLIPTVGAGQTSRFTYNPAGLFAGGSSTEAGAASVTMSWTLSGAQSWTISAASFKAA